MSWLKIPDPIYEFTVAGEEVAVVLREDLGIVDRLPAGGDRGEIRAAGELLNGDRAIALRFDGRFGRSPRTWEMGKGNQIHQSRRCGGEDSCGNAQFGADAIGQRREGRGAAGFAVPVFAFTVRLLTPDRAGLDGGQGQRGVG